MTTFSRLGLGPRIASRMIGEMKDNRSIRNGVLVSMICSAAALGQAVPDSVYPPPEPGQTYGEPDELSRPGVSFGLDVTYLTDDVWRGIERFDSVRDEDELNLQIHNRLAFDLGKLPHPFVDLHVNIADGDPISSFQEVRPTVGFDWKVKPITISAGHINYIFPDREEFDSAEVFLKLTLDDGALFKADRPILSPYVFAAYDYDTWEGLYVQAGVKHEMPIENTDLVLSFRGSVSYVNGQGLFSLGDDDSGFQSWEVGFSARYTFNKALNIPDRYGQWSVIGYLNYTDQIDTELNATNQLWGGMGLSFEF
jgi:hypothetical protein